MDYSFSRINLARCLLPIDFYNDISLADDDYRARMIDRAFELAHELTSLRISSRLKGGKAVYSFSALEEKLVYRLCAKIIRKKCRVYLKPRAQIIKELRGQLSEGARYRVYRLDISSFFESCQADVVLSALAKFRFPTHLEKIIRHLLEQHANGLPRGIEVSPILAEIVLKSFDAEVRQHPEVFYYARFVDDFVMVTSGHEDRRSFLSWIRKKLPLGLQLNHNKKNIFDLESQVQNRPDPLVGELEFLGYRLNIYDSAKNKDERSHKFREVKLDISPSKVKKIKSKIYKAFYKFSKDEDYQMLLDRITFMTSNRDLIRKEKKRKVPTGIYYSYSVLDFPSAALAELDSELQSLILNPWGRVSYRRRIFSPVEKDRLLKLSFSHGFKERVFKRYSPKKMKEIARIW